MCGITGYLNFDCEHVAPAGVIKKMTASISHRGPDGEGYYFKSNLALGHRRLAVIDLEKGNQPMFNDDETVVIVYNGEIFNYTELRKQLMSLGHHFVTDSDTEVIIRAYEEWGTRCQNRLNGMWAFAIWDSAKNELFLSRDRYGIKPLYYYYDTDRLVFASELKAFHAFTDLNLDYNELWDELVFGPKAGGKTHFKGINELEPGHYLLINHGTFVKKQYYSLEDSLTCDFGDMNLAEFHDLIVDSVVKRLMSDVPLGSLNSGGLDSSLISAIAARHTDHKLHTFSVAPEFLGGNKQTGDESAYAQRLSRLIDSEHTTVRYSEDDFLAQMERLVFVNDGILAHPHSIALNILFKEIKSNYGITVVLSGEGADEIFRGYSINREANIYDLLNPLPFGRKLFEEVLLPKRYPNHDDKAFEEYPVPQKLAILRNQQIHSETASKLLGINGSISEDRLKILEKTMSLPGLNGLVYYEQKCYLSGLLKRADRMSMDWGVEVRVPFLDYRIVDSINKLRFSEKSGIGSNATKRILRKIGEKYLPKSISYRKKYSFASPLCAYEHKLKRRLIHQNAERFVKCQTPQELFLISNVFSMKKLSPLN